MAMLFYKIQVRELVKNSDLNRIVINNRDYKYYFILKKNKSWNKYQPKPFEKVKINLKTLLFRNTK